MRHARPRHGPVLAASALLGWAALPAPEAAAQMLRNSAPRTEQGPAVRPPPPALPGLQGRRAPEPIPGDPTQSLSPNEALFDAINRGDLAAAREAVARGADTEARNVLGLTPVDAAVDQGRTEIMFYLLSVRGASRGAPPPSDAEQRAAAARQAPPSRRNARRGGGGEEYDLARPAPAEAPAPLRSARLWANDGGPPNPAIGFLGFDAGRPAGAGPPAAATAPARAPRPSRAGSAAGSGRG